MQSVADPGFAKGWGGDNGGPGAELLVGVRDETL